MKKVVLSENAIRSYGIHLNLYSLREIGKAAGLGPNTLYRLDTFYSQTANKLANFLGCNPLELLEVVEVEEEESKTDPKGIALPVPPTQSMLVEITA